MLLGLAYLDRSESAKALAAFQRAVKTGPQSAEAHNWLGVALAEKSDFPGAIAEFRKAIALDPKYGRAYTNLGSTLAQSGDYAAAVKVFAQALALEPNSIGAHMNLGTALRETGRSATARSNTCAGWPTPIRRTPASSTSSGRRCGRAETSPGAIAAFERALAIDPEMREGVLRAWATR